MSEDHSILLPAKAVITKLQPFFSVILADLELVATDKIPTAATDGHKLWYNPDYVKSLCLDKKGQIAASRQRAAVLVHEILHNASKHIFRRPAETNDCPIYRQVWQLATDYAINPIIVDCGFELGPGWLIDERFKGMFAEKIYGILKSEIADKAHQQLAKMKEQGQKGQKGQGTPGGDTESKDGEGGDKSEGKEGGEGKGRKPAPGEQSTTKCTCGDHGDYTGPGAFDELPDAAPGNKDGDGNVRDEKYWEEKVAAAAQIAKARGNVPGSLQSFIDRVLAPPRLPWQAILRKLVSEYTRKDYGFRPDRRFVEQDMYIADLDSNKKTVWIGVDSSGSVSDAELKDFLIEIVGMLRTADVSIRLLVCDADIHQDMRIDGMGDIPESFSFKGRGGTSFRPVFKRAEEEPTKPQMLIYFTDMEIGGDWPDKPDFPVVWISQKPTPHSVPPYGYHLTIYDE